MTEIFDMRIVQEAKDTMKTKFPLMVEYFLEDSQIYVNDIKSGKTVTEAAHTLKSSSRQMGAVKLSNIAREIEEVSRGGGQPTVYLAPLEEAYREVVEAFKNI